MNIKLNHIYPIKELISKLKDNNIISWADERHREIPLDLFITVFTYKYGLIYNFNIFVERRKTCFGVESKNDYVLTCENFGFRYSFPIY